MNIRQFLLAAWRDETGAITGSFWFGLTYEKGFGGTHSFDMEATTVSVMLMLDTYAEAPDTHDFRDDLTSTEVVTGSGYVTGGIALGATPAWTVASPAAGQMAYDSPDPAWATSTITNAMAAVLYQSTGVAANDELYMLSDFVTAVSTSNGTLTVQVDGNGWMFIDYSTI